jgi:hypothetical protein
MKSAAGKGNRAEAVSHWSGALPFIRSGVARHAGWPRTCARCNAPQAGIGTRLRLAGLRPLRRFRRRCIVMSVAKVSGQLSRAAMMKEKWAGCLGRRLRRSPGLRLAKNWPLASLGRTAHRRRRGARTVCLRAGGAGQHGCGNAQCDAAKDGERGRQNDAFHDA